MRKKTNKETILLTIILIFITISIVVLKYYSNYKQKQQNQKITQNQNLSYLNIEIPDDLVVLKPWEYSKETLDKEPTIPSKNEADNIYKNVVLEIRTRDSSVLDYINTERKWHATQQKEFLGQTKDGKSIFRLTGKDLSDSFKKYAPKDLLNMTPNIDLMKLEKVEKYVMPERFDSSFIVVDENNKPLYKVVPTRWNYTVKLHYKIDDPQNRATGSGEVILAYDKDKWTFLGDSWYLKYNDNSTFINDNDNVQSTDKIWEVNLINDKYSPSFLTINQGEVVKWNSINGIIISDDTCPEPFASPVLNGAKNLSFEKKFTKPGKCIYTIYNIEKNQQYKGIIKIK